MKQQAFKTHTGELVRGKRLQQAIDSVADEWERMARAIRQEDDYASHVAEKTKELRLQEGIQTSRRIRNGTEPMGFWLWQRINTELTGECVPFLPKQPSQGEGLT